MITIEEARKCLDVADENRHVDGWQYDTEFTTEVVSIMYTLAGVLYLKLEKAGLIPKFSHKVDKNEYSGVGHGFEWDADVSICRLAISEALKKNGWVFPSEYNFVPDTEGSPCYGQFWSEDLHDLDPDFAVEFINDTCYVYGYDFETERDEAEDSNVDGEEKQLAVNKYIDRFNYECGLDMAALTIYNPHWHEITDRFLSIDSPSKVLEAKFEELDLAIRRFETCAFMGDSTHAYLPNGHQLVSNFVYPFIDSDGYGTAFHLNPLLYLSLSAPLDAVELRKKMDELDVLIRKEMK